MPAPPSCRAGSALEPEPPCWCVGEAALGYHCCVSAPSLAALGRGDSEEAEAEVIERGGEDDSSHAADVGWHGDITLCASSPFAACAEDSVESEDSCPPPPLQQPTVP